jgi:hypothetical protein
MRAFNPDSYKKEKWLYDTPEVVLSEQVRNKKIYFYQILIFFLL